MSNGVALICTVELKAKALVRLTSKAGKQAEKRPKAVSRS